MFARAWQRTTFRSLAAVGAGVLGGFLPSVRCAEGYVPWGNKEYDPWGNPPPWRLETGRAVVPMQRELLKGRLGHVATGAHDTLLVVANGVCDRVKHGVDPRVAADTCVSGIFKRVGKSGAGADKGLDRMVGDFVALNSFTGKGKGTVAVTAACLWPSDYQLECLSVGDGLLLVLRRGDEREGWKWRLVASVKDPQSRGPCIQQVGDRWFRTNHAPTHTRVDVRYGDMVVLASGGVADTLGADGIVRALNAPAAQLARTPEATAHYLVGMAFLRSVMCVPEFSAPVDSSVPSNTPTPFEQRRRQCHQRPDLSGCGHQGDISVLVGVISS